MALSSPHTSMSFSREMSGSWGKWSVETSHCRRVEPNPQFCLIVQIIHKGLLKGRKAPVCPPLLRHIRVRHTQPTASHSSQGKEEETSQEFQPKALPHSSQLDTDPPVRLEIDCLSSPPILGYPDMTLSFVLHCDASQDGLGAVLYQRQGGKMTIIAYGSRTLTPPEKDYHMHSGKLEFLAMKWAVFERFRDYLYHAPSFVVYTDNNPLTYVLTTAKLNATGNHWVAELADFNFTIKYRPGKSNADADGFSRMPLDINGFMSQCTEEIRPNTISATMTGVTVRREKPTWESVCFQALSLVHDAPTNALGSPLTLEELREAQEKDSVIGGAPLYLRRDQRPLRHQLNAEDPDVCVLLRQWLKLYLSSEGVLHRRAVEKD